MHSIIIPFDDMELELPAKYQVCPMCHGHGREYDLELEQHIRCPACQGIRVIAIPDEDNCTDLELKLFKENSARARSHMG